MSDDQKYLDMLDSIREPQIAKTKSHRQLLEKAISPLNPLIDALIARGDAIRKEINFNGDDSALVFIHLAKSKVPAHFTIEMSEDSYKPGTFKWKVDRFRGLVSEEVDPTGDYDELKTFIVERIALLEQDAR